MSENITGMNEPQAASNAEWYYSESGKRYGPVPEETVYELIRRGEIAKDSYVRTDSMQDWLPIMKSKFVDFMKPVKLSYLSRSIIWLLAFIPVIAFLLIGGFIVLVGLLIAATAPNVFDILDSDRMMSYAILGAGLLNFALTVLFSIMLAYQDKKNLAAEGQNIDKLGKPWQVPVYLSKRVKILRHRGAYKITWAVLLLISIFIHLAILR